MISRKAAAGERGGGREVLASFPVTLSIGLGLLSDSLARRERCVFAFLGSTCDANAC